MLTIFANMRIDSEKSLQHLKDSLFSFRGISDNWLINVRGGKRQEAMTFLKENLADELTLFEFTDEKHWFRDSLKIVEKAKYDYILFWNEDHLNLVSDSVYNNIVTEMKKEDIDYLMYSWWLGGKARTAFETSMLRPHQYIDSVCLTKSDWKKQVKKGFDDYLISVVAILKKDLLIKLIEGEAHKLPRRLTTYIYLVMMILRKLGLKFNHRRVFDFLNRLFAGKLTKKDFGPFDIEKSQYRWDVLPLKIGLPREELMACIDDDLNESGYKIGYQLIKRGLYPVNNQLNMNQGKKTTFDWGDEELLEDNDRYVVRRHHLKQGHKFEKIYYSDEYRIESYPLETITNLGSELKLKMNDKEIIIRPGDTITIHPNIKHEIVSENGDGKFIATIAKEIDNID